MPRLDDAGCSLLYAALARGAWSASRDQPRPLLLSRSSPGRPCPHLKRCSPARVAARFPIEDLSPPRQRHTPMRDTYRGVHAVARPVSCACMARGHLPGSGQRMRPSNACHARQIQTCSTSWPHSSRSFAQTSCNAASALAPSAERPRSAEHSFFARDRSACGAKETRPSRPLSARAHFKAAGTSVDAVFHSSNPPDVTPNGADLHTSQLAGRSGSSVV